jgi:hypothetical protein
MTDTLANKIQKWENRVVRIISRADYSLRSTDLRLQALDPWVTDSRSRRRKRFEMFLLFKIVNNNAPTYLKELYIFSFRGRLHGAFSTPGLNSTLFTGLKFQPCL